jgi:hypothetical protein
MVEMIFIYYYNELMAGEWLIVVTRVLGIILALLLIITAIAGCNTAPTVASSVIATTDSLQITTASSASKPITSSTLATNSLQASTNTIEPELVSLPENSNATVDSELGTPEPTDPPGVWVSDDKYGIDGEYTKAASYKAASYNVKADEESIQDAKKYDAKLGEWEYYFDTSRTALLESNSFIFYEFQLCRRNKSGHIEELNIYGFSFTICKNLIFINNNESAGGEWGSWDTWMVSLDGKKQIFIGDSLDVFVPEKGDVLYFADTDMNIYRTDFSYKNVDRLLLLLPDMKDILSKVEPIFRLIKITKVDDDWIYFNADIDSYWQKQFTGDYKIKISGGLVYKVGNDKWYDNSQNDES